MTKEQKENEILNGNGLIKPVTFYLTEEEHKKLIRVVENKYNTKKAVARMMRSYVHSIIYTTYIDKQIR